VSQIQDKEKKPSKHPSCTADGTRLLTDQAVCEYWGNQLEEIFCQDADEPAREDAMEQWVIPTRSAEHPEGRDPEDGGVPSLAEIQAAVHRLKPGTAAGLDNIPAEVFKWSPKARFYLCHFIQKMWIEERVPASLVRGSVTMIHKAKSADDPRNYRPICVTSTCYRVMTMVMHKRTIDTIERYVRDSQYGNRSNRRCADALSVIATVVRQYMDEGVQRPTAPPNEQTPTEAVRTNFLVFMDYQQPSRRSATRRCCLDSSQPESQTKSSP
jgi:hypothetical protein